MPVANKRHGNSFKTAGDCNIPMKHFVPVDHIASILRVSLTRNRTLRVVFCFSVGDYTNCVGKSQWNVVDTASVLHYLCLLQFVPGLCCCWVSWALVLFSCLVSVGFDIPFPLSTAPLWDCYTFQSFLGSHCLVTQHGEHILTNIC